MFRALCAHHQEVKLYFTASDIITLRRWPSGTQVEHVETYNILIIKQEFGH